MVAELRAQARTLLPSDGEVQVENAEELLDSTSSWLNAKEELDIPDFGSDDSDGPPSDVEAEVDGTSIPEFSSPNHCCSGHLGEADARL